jgi:SAM-dependent methyltransferase
MRSLIDIGYTWPWTSGHLVILAVALGAFGLARWRGWHWLTLAAFGLLAAWALAAFLVVQFVFRFNDIPALPTQSFLASGTGRVVDLGAGSGRSSIMVLRERPGATLVALDNFSATYIRDHGPAKLAANLRAAGVDGRAEVKPGDMRELPFPDASFDAVISAYAVDHLDREGAARTLREASRVLRPGGQILLQIMNPDWWMRLAWGPMLLHGAHAGSMRDRWTASLERAGFRVVEQGTQPASLYLLAVKR